MCVLNGLLCIAEKIKKSLTDFCLIQFKMGKILRDVSLKYNAQIIQCRSKGIGNSIKPQACIC